jgi:hypothetical protein
VTGLTSAAIRETLTFRSLERARRTFPVFSFRVFHLKSHSVPTPPMDNWASSVTQTFETIDGVEWLHSLGSAPCLLACSLLGRE